MSRRTTVTGGWWMVEAAPQLRVAARLAGPWSRVVWAGASMPAWVPRLMLAAGLAAGVLLVSATPVAAAVAGAAAVVAVAVSECLVRGASSRGVMGRVDVLAVLAQPDCGRPHEGHPWGLRAERPGCVWAALVAAGEEPVVGRLKERMALTAQRLFVAVQVLACGRGLLRACRGADQEKLDQVAVVLEEWERVKAAAVAELLALRERSAGQVRAASAGRGLS